MCAIKVPSFPYNFSVNKTYLYLVNTYPEKQKWDIQHLERKFGKTFTTQVVNSGILVLDRRNHQIGQLSFQVCGTMSRLICQLVEHEICSFIELRNKLPQSSRPSSTRLKNTLSFLTNFKQIQTFPCPITALTAVVRDSEATEQMVDEFFALSDLLESKFIYTVDRDEGLPEFTKMRQQA